MTNTGHLAEPMSSILMSVEINHPPAYLDPGSGSYFLQLLAAGILGSLFVVRAFWSRLKDRITRRKKPDQDEAHRE